MPSQAEFPGYGVAPQVPGALTTGSDFLGREIRTGSWEELSRGTFQQAQAAAARGDADGAVSLLNLTLLEAQELREVYEEWPNRILAWLQEQGVDDTTIGQEQSKLGDLIGPAAMEGIEAAWPEYVTAVKDTNELLKAGAPSGSAAIESARLIWQRIHDEAVDRVSGLISIATRLSGEDNLGALWNYLMADWYDVHERRYSLENQPWEISIHQLLVSIVDGFHAHLAGITRQGDMEIIREEDRIGFRFAPCGSGGRSVSSAITDGSPRAAAPYDFAVTTEKHDWAWNTVGICSYCVHCCLLNEVTPIDRLGYPTRVIDPPVWDGGEPEDTSCTWWVYRDPSLVPDEVYERVGRKPDRRPARFPTTETRSN